VSACNCHGGPTCCRYAPRGVRYFDPYKGCVCESYEYGSGAEIPKPNPECRKCFPRHPAPYTEGAPDPARLSGEAMP
jgi:hypothetical protein